MALRVSVVRCPEWRAIAPTNRSSSDLPPDFGPHVMWEIKVITPLVVRTRQAEHSQVNCAVGSRCNVLSIA